MELSLNWKNLFYLGSQFIGYAVGFVLIVSALRRNRQNLLIGLAVLIITYSAFIAGLISSGLFVHFPALYRTGNLVALLFAPVLLFYIRNVIRKTGLRPLDLLHFLPALLYLIDYWPVFMLPTAEKLVLMQSEISDPALFTLYTQSRLFPYNFYTPFRTIQVTVYWFICVRLVYQYSKTVSGKDDFPGKEWLAWVKIFLGLLSMIFLPFFATFWFLDAHTTFHVVHAITGILGVFTGVSLLFYPQILYGLTNVRRQSREVPAVAESPKEKPVRVNKLTSEKAAEIREKVDAVMLRQKSFLKQGYSVTGLAMDAGIPAYLLTEYIHRSLQTTFSDLINRQRIEESCRLIASGAYEQYSIDGLAEMSGFSNRNSYITAFKKFKNATPSEYIRTFRAQEN
jgi:AraC-like DNA-binding protein